MPARYIHYVPRINDNADGYRIHKDYLDYSNFAILFFRCNPVSPVAAVCYLHSKDYKPWRAGYGKYQWQVGKQDCIADYLLRLCE